MRAIAEIFSCGFRGFGEDAAMSTAVMNADHRSEARQFRRWRRSRRGRARPADLDQRLRRPWCDSPTDALSDRRRHRHHRRHLSRHPDPAFARHRRDLRNVLRQAAQAPRRRSGRMDMLGEIIADRAGTPSGSSAASRIYPKVGSAVVPDRRARAAADLRRGGPEHHQCRASAAGPLDRRLCRRRGDGAEAFRHLRRDRRRQVERGRADPARDHGGADWTCAFC